MQFIAVVVGLQQQHGLCMLKAEIAAYYAQLASADPGYVCVKTKNSVAEGNKCFSVIPCNGRPGKN